MNNYVCPICGNSDNRYIGFKKNKPYCRRCISFQGDKAPIHIIKKRPCKLNINYILTKEQNEISREALQEYLKGHNVLLYAVCGAGKTELVYGLISYALSNGLQVGFAIPRREVVIELFDRLHKAFSNNSVVAVYGGHSDILVGDIVVLTTHQLYRYPHYFDLLIIDEIDAFPFKDNDLLNEMFFRSVKGNYVMMSATPDNKTIKEFNKPNNKILSLKIRYHYQPIPVPKLIICPSFIKYFYTIKLLKKFISNHKQVFIFTPTIAKCERFYNIISKLISNGNYVHSKREEQSKIIGDFKDHKYNYLVTTAVLERGITVKGLQVIIIDADHPLYNEFALVQIAGRVGRKKEDAFGEVYFLSDKITKEMENACNTIKECNKNLQSML